MLKNAKNFLAFPPLLLAELNAFFQLVRAAFEILSRSTDIKAL